MLFLAAFEVITAQLFQPLRLLYIIFGSTLKENTDCEKSNMYYACKLSVTAKSLASYETTL